MTRLVEVWKVRDEDQYHNVSGPFRSLVHTCVSFWLFFGASLKAKLQTYGLFERVVLEEERQEEALKEDAGKKSAIKSC